MDIPEAQLSWIMGCLLLFGLVMCFPLIMRVFALRREERALGKLYWHWRTALDQRSRSDR